MSIRRLMDELEGTPDPDARSKALQEEGELYRLIVEGASDFAIFTLDLQRRVLTWNAGAERLTGFAEADILGRSGDILFTPEDRQGGVPEGEVGRAISEGRAEDDRWLVRRDGSRIFASGLLMPLRDEAGEVRAFLKIFRDLTQQKRDREAFEESKEQFHAVADLVPDLLWRNGPGGESEWVNRRWTDYTGQALEEASGFGCPNHFPRGQDRQGPVGG
jgi:PAS domain S-box-containing protein